MRSGRSAIRPTIVTLVVAALTVVGMVTVVAKTNTAAAAAAVEDDGASCSVSLPSSLTANPLLPDPFTRLDGTRISSTSDWRCRREEILQLAEKYVYGQKPAKPASVTGTVSSTAITVNVSDNGKSSSFSAGVTLPSGSGPFPAVVVVGGLGADTATILGQGVAVINYDPTKVGAEGTPRSNKQGAFYTLYGSSSSTGLLMAWAWGVSRIIDVIQQSGGTILKADSVGVTGCSRFGKGAIVSGAFDQRIALTMPIESGTDGVPIFRGVPGESGAQPLGESFNEQPWVGDAFSSFTGNPAMLPVDTDEVLGMVAPRGLFIMENPHIDWLAARSGSVAALGGAEIYKALGAGSNISYWSDVQDGTHCAVRPEWKTPLQQSLQKFLLNKGSAPGVFRVSSLKQGDLSQWRNWQTPVLSDTPPSTTPPSTTPPATTPPPTGCTASVSIDQFSGGFVATVQVTAGSSSVNGWTVAMTLPAGAAIVNTWNASPSGASGTVQFTNLSYNASISAGQSTQFGYQGTGTGAGMTPTCSAT